MNIYKLILPLLLVSNNSHADSIDTAVNNFLEPISNALSTIVFFSIPILGADVPLIVIWLACAAIFFTCYLKFINLRGFSHGLQLIRGDYSNPKAKGEISHFQAVATAISGTVGVGNIGGVAIAITIGGPGAAFWLVFAGFLSMSTKLVECTLGVMYRRHHEDGSVSGGPMYYLEHGIAEKGWPKLGKTMGIFYALAMVVGCLGIGNMFQSNQAYIQFVNITGGEQSFFAEHSWLFGILIAGTVATVIIGGIHSIARVAERIVPLMAILYVVSTIVIISFNYQFIPTAFKLIFQGAFTSDGITGGMIGVMVIGFQRALFSNEAGLGSASIAHSAVKTNEPVSEGIVSLLEPFIDTIVICTLSSLVIITTAIPYGLMDSGLKGIELTSAAFAYHISWFPYPLALAALLFAFSTSIAWSYYGLKSWTYLFGSKKNSQLIFKMIFCLFIALGCMVQLDSIIKISDALVFIIAIPNILGLYILAPKVKKELHQYMAKLQQGKLKNYRQLKHNKTVSSIAIVQK
ncbi:alanine:cation symporter family protein [Endozoicomonas sp. SM1973]|uniref:Alanine:cation symporter family protein n=1 Tax=Spartinivicinus marinus TaxID=2994442 RepID=A0A853I793_9GAMM|nr:alanine/glycine:cation symporter family protein [Spartinivicinus marinus]MCX4025853.1 alanine/glycine:cation symporter family protein [Spartinivicinus marinus]NYZ68669.1 alanine:cation symporter family protein [Spartinivicinus marinus]